MSHGTRGLIALVAFLVIGAVAVKESRRDRTEDRSPRGNLRLLRLTLLAAAFALLAATELARA